MAVSVEIHLSGQRISLSCPYYSSEPLNGYAHSLLESLTRLLQEGHEQPIHPKGCAGVALFMKIPKCFDSHILLAFPLIENPDGSRVQHIYGIELDANLYLQRDEILQEVAHTFGAQGIRHLIPDIVSRPDPADSLQPNTSFDDLNALDKKRRFGCGTLFLAELDDGYAACSSPSSSCSQCLSPNLGPAVDPYVNAFAKPRSSQTDHPTTDADVFVATPHAVPKQVDLGPTKALREDLVPTQVESEMPTLNYKAWERLAGDTGFLQRHQAESPSIARYQPMYQYRNDTTTVDIPPLQLVTASTATVTKSHDPMQSGEALPTSESSEESLHDDQPEAPLCKQQRILGTFLGLPSDMVASLVPGKLQQDRRSEPASEASAVETLPNTQSRRMSDPTLSTSLCHTTASVRVQHKAPVQRQTSAEGKAVITAGNTLSKQLNFKLSLQGLQHQGISHHARQANEDHLGQSVEAEKESIATSTCTLETRSLSEEKSPNVHALEHACNGVCILGSTCKECNPEHVKKMFERVMRIRDGEPADEDMKQYIRRHCEYCKSRDCRVPHAAAGCLSPALLPVSNGNLSLGGCNGITDVSFDLQANCSNSESDRASSALIVTTCTDSSKTNSPFKPCQDTNVDSPDLPNGQVCMPRDLHHPHRRTFVASPDIVQTRPADQRCGSLGITRRLRGGVAYPAVSTVNAGHRTYSYLEHNPGVLQKQVPRASHQVPDVRKTGFVGASTYGPCQPGTVIYSSDEIQHMVPGYTIPVPNIDGVPSADILGVGGNGKTFKYHFNKKEFAVKWTCYRPIELNLWYKFKHPNVIPLHAVAWASDGRCFQFMPRMTTNLSRVLRDIGSLSAICEQVDEHVWRYTTLPNARYILRAILQGIRYLHDECNVQHCDIKASNVLIHKTCNCADVFRCTCPQRYKYVVQIADFDSARSPSSSNQNVASIPEVPCVLKTSEECMKVMGTPGYRAPEQFVKAAPAVPPCHVCVSHEGPWCDIWSFGILVLQMCLGPNNTTDKRKAWMLSFERHRKEFSRSEPQVEGPHALIKLINLLSSEHPQLQLAGLFAKACLEIDYHERLTAVHLLNHKFMQE